MADAEALRDAARSRAAELAASLLPLVLPAGRGD
jgi:hypothetical protein